MYTNTQCVNMKRRTHSQPDASGTFCLLHGKSYKLTSCCTHTLESSGKEKAMLVCTVSCLMYDRMVPQLSNYTVCQCFSTYGLCSTCNGSWDNADRSFRRYMNSICSHWMFLINTVLQRGISGFIFTRHQMEENRLKQGGTTWTFPIRNSCFHFPLQNILLLRVLMNTTLYLFVPGTKPVENHPSLIPLALCLSVGLSETEPWAPTTSIALCVVTCREYFFFTKNNLL